MSVKINIIRGEKDQEELVETIELNMKSKLWYLLIIKNEHMF